jgi:hypothetical protein
MLKEVVSMNLFTSLPAHSLRNLLSQIGEPGTSYDVTVHCMMNTDAEGGLKVQALVRCMFQGASQQSRVRGAEKNVGVGQDAVALVAMSIEGRRNLLSFSPGVDTLLVGGVFLLIQGPMLKAHLIALG